jgi:hypothetical protein
MRPGKIRQDVHDYLVSVEMVTDRAALGHAQPSAYRIRHQDEKITSAISMRSKELVTAKRSAGEFEIRHGCRFQLYVGDSILKWRKMADRPSRLEFG